MITNTKQLSIHWKSQIPYFLDAFVTITIMIIVVVVVFMEIVIIKNGIFFLDFTRLLR